MKIGTVLRLIGGVPSEAELAKISLEWVGDSTVTFAQFLEIVQKHRAGHGFMAEELRLVGVSCL